MFAKIFLVSFSILFLFAQCSSSLTEEIKEHEESTVSKLYTKKEVYITMRDGVRLFTAIYTPKDTSKTYPVILKRTPYSAAPYGSDTLPSKLNNNTHLVESGYIFIIQDVRGRWMSEGVFENTKPPYSLTDSSKTDEITDSWDTFEWLKDSLKHYNGNAGIMGNSYLGYTSLVAAKTNHPSLKAVLAMAPVTNFYFEDFNRYGLFALNYVPVIPVFGTPKSAPVDTAWWKDRSMAIGINSDYGIGPDYYDFFLQRFTLGNYADIIDSNDFFWQNIQDHPNYDAYRQERDWIQYLTDINCPMLIVGGWNDEQNLYGILNSYKKLEKDSPNAHAKMIMGPWSHGHPTKNDSAYYLGDIFYGDMLSADYMKNEEFVYFEHHLKGEKDTLPFQVKLFDTGINKWKEFHEYPDYANNSDTFFLNQSNQLTKEQEGNIGYLTYISDPFHPVPFMEGDDFHAMAPKSYFTADQRYASKRPDVLTYSSELLTDDLTVIGEILAQIEFSTSETAADLYVKIIDVYPMDRAPKTTDKEGVKMNGYQQLVRAGYIRGRYRDGFEKGVPFIANEKTSVNVPLLDICHTFKKGHKIMVQVQSSMFPLFDLNPQQYIENIYKAKREDFTIAMHSVYNDSKLILPIQKN
jgi:putative CocE/NonD family hydrolase